MDYSESTKVVFQRIEKLDPENVSKIIGYLLLQDHGELEMIRLAFGPEYILQSLIHKVKQELSLSSKPNISTPVSSRPSISSNLDPTEFTPAAATPPNIVIQWINPEIPNGPHNFPCFPIGYMDQPHLLSLEDQWLGSFDHFAVHPIMPDFPAFATQICHNFRLGYCKYGGSCRFLHVLQMENGRFMVLNPKNADDEAMTNCGGRRVIKSGPLKQLEMELLEILKCRRGIPVSVSCLPILYCDTFGRLLNVGEYLTEPYMGGDIISGLTQVLAQMTSNCLRIIDRPRGQLSLILVGDIPKYVRFVEEINNESKLSVANACHVYLTFPPHSVFNEQDVHDYFINYGPVQEVRIPCQEKRMFGFVTFVYPETAALVLTKTNPHFIGGEHVLVKPYRHRPMLLERKTEEKARNLTRINPCFTHAESSTPSTPSKNTKLLEKQQLEEQHHELEAKCIMETGVTNSLSNNHSHTSDGSSNSSEALGCTSEDKVDHIKSCKNDEESVGDVALPDSPVCM